MKAILKKMTVALGLVAIGTILTAAANAECGDLSDTNQAHHFYRNPGRE